MNAMKFKKDTCIYSCIVFSHFFFTNDFKIIAHLCLRTEENKTDEKKNENKFLTQYNYILG